MTQAARLNSPRHLSPTSSVRTFAFVVLRTAQIVLIAAALSAVAAFAVGGLVLHMAISPVLTGSMQPAFSPGDAVITRLVDAHSLHKGDIAVFVPPGESAPYAHRITNVTEKNGHVVVTTKGDANPAPDRWHASLNGDQVQVVVAHVPHFGRVMAWTAEPWMRALTIALVGLVFTAIGTTAILRGGDSRSRRTRIPLTTN
jgi:signal peptidase